MVPPENPSYWSHFDYSTLIDDIPVPDGPYAGFSWSTQPTNAPSTAVNVEIDNSFGDLDGLAESGSKKRGRSESCNPSNSKACREKLRRDRLNDKFMELGAILEPGRPPKTDKSAILVDAVRMVTQLRDEAQKMKDSNSSLQERIKELKAEKNELREEKQRLKAEKEKLEQQLKTMNAQPSFMPPAPAIPAAFAAAAQGQAPGKKSGNVAIHATCSSGYLSGSCTPPSGCIRWQPIMNWDLHFDANKGIGFVIVLGCSRIKSSTESEAFCNISVTKSVLKAMNS
ncbi:hypothetical protein CXB51_034217 [Gossypium anomalum]|uniref:BHLH domain-containing protein n=1 Tax=Gossypium anomalum TaxID=47600 RepID=A0A8J6CH57_9ROSI|nr:hypothetical protein CXB51_034217 [Gossypium anomalum]